MRCNEILMAPQNHPEETTGRAHTHFFVLCLELMCVTGGPSWYVRKEVGPDTSWIRGTYWLELLTFRFLQERSKLGSCLSRCHFRSVIHTKSNLNKHSSYLSLLLAGRNFPFFCKDFLSRIPAALVDCESPGPSLFPNRMGR